MRSTGGPAELYRRMQWMRDHAKRCAIVCKSQPDLERWLSFAEYLERFIGICVVDIEENGVLDSKNEPRHKRNGWAQRQSRRLRIMK